MQLKSVPISKIYDTQYEPRVIFKLCMTVYKCLQGLAPKYLAELWVPVADVAGRRQLRSASFWIFLATTCQAMIDVRSVFKRSLETFLLQQISHLAH